MTPDADAHGARPRRDPEAPGGAAAVNVFTRIQLALFAAGPWATIPTMPPELILAPRWFPVHLGEDGLLGADGDRAAAGARRAQAGGAQPEAMCASTSCICRRATVKPKSNVAGAKAFWKAAFGALDVVLKAGDGLWPKAPPPPGDRRAACAFVVERLNGDDGLGAIYPAMANSVMMFDCLGDHVAPRHRPRRGREADRPAARRRNLLPAVPVAGVGYGARRARHARGAVAGRRGRGRRAGSTG